MYHYRVLSEVECEPIECATANLAVELAMRKLGIPKPNVCFITEDPAGPIVKEYRIAGASGPTNKLFILRGQTLDQIVRTVAHECEHLRWYARGMVGSVKHAERSAFLFETDFWGVAPPNRKRLGRAQKNESGNGRGRAADI
jgi:hypothetical protein